MLNTDVRIRGVWQSQVDALFDVRVVDTDAPSYQSRSPQAVLCTAEVEKRRKYGAACLARRASFTPLCFSVDGLFGSEADYFLRRLADSLSVKWEKNYSVVMGYVGHDYHLQLFEQPYYVCVDHERNGDH